MRSPTGTGVPYSKKYWANHDRTLVQKTFNPAFDLRISIPAKKNELAGWIDDDHLRMSAARKASSWAEVMKVVELPARDTKALIRPLRTKSLSAAKTAARFVRAPEIRIAFSMIPLGISKFTFTHKTYFFLRIKISGIGTNTLTIEGVKSLKGATHRISADYLEAGSFLALAAVTGGELKIKNTAPQNMRMILQTFGRLGIRTEIKGQDILVPKGQSLEVEKEFGGAVPHIADAPWPGFPADMTSVALVTATQCKGTVLIHEKLFESRLFFVDGLLEMGARIILCDPHRAVVLGSDKFRGAKLASPDIRAGMALLIAALCAEGESEIRNISQIDRGFSRIEERLRSLGAKIERK